MIEKGVRGVISHALYRYAKRNNKYMKDYDLKRNPSYLMYLDFKNLYG